MKGHPFTTSSIKKNITMKSIKFITSICLLIVFTSLSAQNIKLEANQLETHQTYLSIEKLAGKQVLRVVKDSTVKAVDSKYPVLIVKDLKLGDKVSGGIGLWVDVGTEGYFKEVKVINQ